MWLEAAIVAVVAPIVFTVAQSFFKGYGQRKGENLATREDIESVNRRIETLQASFSIAVAKTAASHEHRFASELAIYRELWDKVVDLQQAADKVWYHGIATKGQQTGYRVFEESLGSLRETIHRLRPFFPADLYVPLLKAQLPLRELAARVSMMDFSDTAVISAFVEKSWPSISSGFSTLEEAIRAKLAADEAALKEVLERRDLR
jgi:hypothetical protein